MTDYDLDSRSTTAKKTIVDTVLFRMPKDRELQWAAVAVMQAYVNDFDQKMYMHNYVAPDAKFKLVYNHTLSEQDWEIFIKAGLKLQNMPEALGCLPDAIMDFTESRLETLADTNKHVAQLFGIMAGIACPPMPEIRIVAPAPPSRWAVIEDIDVSQVYMRMLGEELLHAKDGELTGVIGKAGWETYLAASMGLPVVEIVPADRKRIWLSKFQSKVYRVVKEPSNVQEQVTRAVASLEALLGYAFGELTKKNGRVPDSEDWMRFLYPPQREG